MLVKQVPYKKKRTIQLSPERVEEQLIKLPIVGSCSSQLLGKNQLVNKNFIRILVSWCLRVTST